MKCQKAAEALVAPGTAQALLDFDIRSLISFQYDRTVLGDRDIPAD